MPQLPLNTHNGHRTKRKTMRRMRAKMVNTKRTRIQTSTGGKMKCSVCGNPTIYAKGKCVKCYNKEYNQRPEVKQYRKKYNQRPETKKKRDLIRQITQVTNPHTQKRRLENLEIMLKELGEK